MLSRTLRARGVALCETPKPAGAGLTSRQDANPHARKGFGDAAARTAFFTGDEFAGLSDLLAPFASATHAYDVSAALTYVKDGTILPHYQQ